MSQNTVVITDGTGLDVLNRMNNAFNTLVTNNSGSSAPATTYGAMTWYDTTNFQYKIRNNTNTGWLQIPVLDSSGRLLVNLNTSLLFGSAYPYIQLSGTTPDTSSIATSRFSNDGSPAHIRIAKSRGTSIGSYTAVQNGDVLGVTSFWGSDGSGFNTASGIYGICDGTPTSGTSMPGALSFRTTPSGSITPVENAKIDKSGVFYMNSGYGSTGAAYGCRAWVNFNGTGTVYIRASGNVSSITDNGVGAYTINFTTAMPDTNYCATTFARKNNDSVDTAFILAAGSGYGKTTANMSFQIFFGAPGNGGGFDTPEAGIAIFR